MQLQSRDQVRVNGPGLRPATRPAHDTVLATCRLLGCQCALARPAPASLRGLPRLQLHGSQQRSMTGVRCGVKVWSWASRGQLVSAAGEGRAAFSCCAGAARRRRGGSAGSAARPALSQQAQAYRIASAYGCCCCCCCGCEDGGRCPSVWNSLRRSLLALLTSRTSSRCFDCCCRLAACASGSCMGTRRQ